MYAEYLAEASASGLVVGAYHRAKVGVAAGDAKAEADHFIDVARNDRGDVLPVLDIEDANGLNVARLHGLGAHVAQQGLRPDRRPRDDLLEPLLLANLPGRHDVVRRTTGTRCGSRIGACRRRAFRRATGVATGGRSGNAPRPGGSPGSPRTSIAIASTASSLLRGKIASLSVAPAAGGVITGARIACGGARPAAAGSRTRTPSLTLAATPDPGASLLRWTGACSSAGSSPTCDVTALGARRVSAVFGYPVRVQVRGSGSGTVTSAPARIDCGSTCTASFAAGSTVDPDRRRRLRVGLRGVERRGMRRRGSRVLGDRRIAEERRGDVRLGGERGAGRRRYRFRMGAGEPIRTRSAAPTAGSGARGPPRRTRSRAER